MTLTNMKAFNFWGYVDNMLCQNLAVFKDNYRLTIKDRLEKGT